MSIRLKLIRDAMEDDEYLNSLQKAGKGILTFNDNPEALYSAREQLGASLQGLARKPSR